MTGPDQAGGLVQPQPERDQPEERRPARDEPPQHPASTAADSQVASWVRIIAALIGIASLGVGVYAVMETSNQAGAAALIVLAGIFLLIALKVIPLEPGSSRETLSNVALALLVVAGAGATWALEPAVAATQFQKKHPTLQSGTCANAAGTVGKRGAVAVPDKVSNATGTLVISIGRQGDEEQRQSSPLPIQSGNIKFKPGTVLCTAASDFVRSDGQVLPGYQLASKALVSNDGQDVTVRVYVAPRYRQVSGFGEYTGTVSLDEAQATGANVHVTIYVEYPYINRILLLGLLLSCAGLIWGLLVRGADMVGDARNSRGSDRFLANLALRVAVLATAVPIINAQVLSDPAWTGTLSDYIRLGTLVGGAAIAATPTLRAIVSNLGSPASR